MSQIAAAGCVVWRAGSAHPADADAERESVHILVVHRPRYDDWSLPKGKLEPGELLPACAVRETAEETGIQVCLGPQVGTVVYRVEGRKKTVTYWLASVRHTPAVLARPYVEPATEKEIDEFKWVELSQAAELLTYELDRQIVCEARDKLAAGWGRAVPFILVRHAKAKNRQDWKTDDSLRPLKKRGKAQARKLATLLSAFGVMRVLSSPWKRCDQTVKPFLKLTAIRAQYPDALSETGFAANPRQARELVWQQAKLAPREGPTALCSHAPVLRPLMQLLTKDYVPLETGEILVAHVCLDDLGNPQVLTTERHVSRAATGD